MVVSKGFNAGGRLVLFVQLHDFGSDRVKVHLHFFSGFVGTVNFPAFAFGNVEFFHAILVTQRLKLLRHLLGCEPLAFRLIGALWPSYCRATQGDHSTHKNQLHSGLVAQKLGHVISPKGQQVE
jgi:hypothetical protein